MNEATPITLEALDSGEIVIDGLQSGWCEVDLELSDEVAKQSEEGAFWPFKLRLLTVNEFLDLWDSSGEAWHQAGLLIDRRCCPFLIEEIPCHRS